MSASRLFGVETEYALAGVGRDGEGPPPCPGVLLQRLSKAARGLVHLPDAAGAGIFLANGSRFYIDYGDHPEVSSPECLDPWDVVRYSRAGDAIMLRLAEQVRLASPDLAELRVFKSNVDYSGSQTTWGAHESYCHRADPDVLQRRLVPHLVSRVIFCGAGGFDPFSQGLAFMVSPRASHITCVVSHDSTGNRGIIHTRDEPLAVGYQRQHVLCGESLRSDTATWLRVGTTALIVAMIEAGVPCGDDVGLRAPLDALRTISRDTTVRQTVATRAGLLTAHQIQRRYLEHARENLEADWMPPWAVAVCTKWDDILLRLERGPEEVQKTLDWAIKLSIYCSYARRRGFKWEDLQAWTPAADMPDRARDQARARPAQDQQHAPLAALRAQLCEADARFSQLGPCSVFEALDGEGVLEHAVEGLDGIDEAMEEPPRRGRASVRGRMIRTAVAQRRAYRCSWEYILDEGRRVYLDLYDPFTEVARWREQGAEAETRPPESAQEPLGLEPPEEEVRMFVRVLERIRGRGRPPVQNVQNAGER